MSSCSRTSLSAEDFASPWKHRRRASTYNEAHLERTMQILDSPKTPRKRSFSFHEQSSCRKSEDDFSCKKCHDKAPERPPPCPYFEESLKKPPPSSDIISSDTVKPIGNRNLETGLPIFLPDDNTRPLGNKEINLLGRNNSARSTEATKGYEQLTFANSVVTWRSGRRGSSLGT